MQNTKNPVEWGGFIHIKESSDIMRHKKSVAQHEILLVFIKIIFSFLIDLFQRIQVAVVAAMMGLMK